MTDIRSPQWRQNRGISSIDAERRIEEGCVVLDQLANLHPLRIVIDGAFFRDEFREIKVRSIRRKQFKDIRAPGYLAFLAYAWAALKYLAKYHPEVEKLDFVVEKKTTVTQHVQDFHADLPLALAGLAIRNWHGS